MCVHFLVEMMVQVEKDLIGGEAADPQQVGFLQIQQALIQHTINFRVQHSLVPGSFFNVNDLASTVGTLGIPGVIFY